MPNHRSLVAIVVAGVAAHSAAQPTPESFDDRLRQVTSGDSGGYLQSLPLGVSTAGRPISILRVGTPGPEADHRPAILIVAGTDATHRVGVSVALGVAAKLAADHRALLDRFTVYIVPCLNPDTAEALRGAPGPMPVSPAGAGRVMTPDDADHDGRVDEDGPTDLNGDGLITMMRIASPPPGFGLERSLVIDPAEPRILREPDKSKNERPTHALLIEGRDIDGDGRIAEDGVGGVDLDRNFPFRWPEFQDGAGRYATSEAESRILVEWLMGRQLTDGTARNTEGRDNVLAVIEYAPFDNLVNLLPAGPMDETGRVPRGIEEADKAAYETVSKSFKDITGMTGVGGIRGEAAWAGSLAGWAYGHAGVFAFATPVWVRPDLVKKEERKQDDKPAEAAPERKPDAEKPATEPPPAPTSAQPAEPARGGRGASGGGGGGRRFGPRGGGPGGSGGGGPPPGSPKPTVDAGEDGKWLKYFDDRVAGGGEPGFVPWSPFDHPQLGKVEIGGFIPDARLNPPGSELPRLIDEQTRFVVDLLDKLPRLAIEGPFVERVGANVWRVSVRVANEGQLPLRSAIGVKSRRLSSLRLEPDLPADRLVGGERYVSAATLAGSGGSLAAQWLITGAQGDRAAILLKSPELGDRRIDFTLNPSNADALPKEPTP